MYLKKITTLTTIGMPAAIGLGIAWMAMRIIKNEQKIDTRMKELKIELDTKSLKIL
tara:strand:+ start:182 stop:349 length:168 start_codon:yes stop_codon:yes gene_type:complete